MKYIPLLLGLAASLLPAGCLFEPVSYRTREVVPGGLTTEEILKLSKAGISESVLLEKLKSEGVAARPEAGQIDALRKEGVSQQVLDAMLTVSVRPPEERITNYVDAYPYGYYPYGYYPHGYWSGWYGGYGYYPYQYGYYPHYRVSGYYPRSGYTYSVSRYR